MPPTCARERFATAGEKNTAVAWTLPWRSGAPVAGKAGDRASARAGAGGEAQRAVAQHEEPEGEDAETPGAPPQGGVELRHRARHHPNGGGSRTCQRDHARSQRGDPGSTRPPATTTPPHPE